MIKVFGVFPKSRKTPTCRDVLKDMSAAARQRSMKCSTYDLGYAGIGVSCFDCIDRDRRIFFKDGCGGAIVAGNVIGCGGGDARSVFHRYQEKGVSFIPELGNPFSLVIWDDREKKVFVANDKLGFFPVYCYEDADRFIFATEAEIILRINGVKHALDYDGIAQFFQFGYLWGGRTFIAGVKNAEPATLVELSGRRVRKGQYCSKRVWDVRPYNTKDALGLVQETFARAVDCRKGAGEVHFVELTGGRDTRLIVSHLAKESKPIHAFTFFNKDIPLKDVLLARKVAKYFGLRHSLITSKDRRADKVETIKLGGTDVPGVIGEDVDVVPEIDGQAFQRDMYRYPIFSGYMGGEVLGGDVGLHRINGDDFQVREVFSASFLSRLEHDPQKVFNLEKKKTSRAVGEHWPLYVFAAHICRSFFNTIEGRGWERPAYRLVDSKNIYPFIDEDFLRSIFSLPSSNIGAAAYRKFFARFFPGSLTIPFLSDFPRFNRVQRIRQAYELQQVVKEMLGRNKKDPLGFFADARGFSERFPRRYIYFYKWYHLHGKYFQK